MNDVQYVYATDRIFDGSVNRRYNVHIAIGKISSTKHYLPSFTRNDVQSITPMKPTLKLERLATNNCRILYLILLVIIALLTALSEHF